MFNTLTSRLALSYIALAVALNVLVFYVLGIGMKRNLEQGIETILQDLVEDESSFEEALSGFSDHGHDHGGYQLDQFYFRLFDPQGEVVLARGPDQPAAEELANLLVAGEERADTIEHAPGTTLRVVTRRMDDGAVIQAGLLLDENHALFEKFEHYWRVGVLILAVLAGGFGWWIARGAMSGVKEVTRTAEEILEGSFEARVPERHQVVEVKELTATINRMLDKIDLLITDLRFVTVDVAHDFRSPLTRIRGAAEVALREHDSMDAYREMAVRAIEETTRLEAVVETMLEIVRLDSGDDLPRAESIDPGALLSEVVDFYTEAADSRNLTFHLDNMDTRSIKCERTMLQRTLANLVDNAVKFTPAGGSIRLGTVQEPEAVMLYVEDSGPGIPIEDRAHIFERFYRGDASRKEPGHGLGLSYVKSAIDAHGGTVELASSTTGGARLEIRLPA